MYHPVFESKEELESYLKKGNLLGLDCDYSGTAMSLIESFDAKGVDANKWWVMTPVDWVCPSCKRTKPNIVRKNKHGYLIALLHEHHDHMRDLVKKRFEELSSSRDIVVADKLSEKFALRTSYAISAYDNTIICSDCNEADKNAKRIVGTHRDFSYSPNEIGQFIISRSNKEHEINSDIATKIWNEGSELFQTRMNVLNMLAELAASNSHWYQPSEVTAVQTERRARYSLERYGLRKIHYDPEKLLYSTENFKGPSSSWRKKENPLIVDRPTNSQLQHLIQTRGNFWKKVEDSWRCPCCKRSKNECIRPSKKNPWVFEIKGMHLFSNDDERWLASETICNDCANVASSIGREVLAGEEIHWTSSLISILELRQVVIPRPYSQHKINNNEVEKILPILKQRFLSETYYMSPRCKELM